MIWNSRKKGNEQNKNKKRKGKSMKKRWKRSYKRILEKGKESELEWKKEEKIKSVSKSQKVNWYEINIRSTTKEI